MVPPRRALLALAAPLLHSLSLAAAAFQSDELLLNDDDEFEGVGARPFAPSLPAAPVVSSSRRRSADTTLPGAGESNAVQFTLEHDLGNGKGFVPAGTFSACYISWLFGCFAYMVVLVTLCSMDLGWLALSYFWIVISAALTLFVGVLLMLGHFVTASLLDSPKE